VDEQRIAASDIQDRLLAELGSKGHEPGLVHKYKYTPHIAMTVDSEALNALLSSEHTVSVEEDILLAPTLNWSVPRIGATQLHTANVKGTGMTVAILDTGVDKAHSFLQDSVVSEACYSTNDQSQGSTSLCPGGLEESTAPGSAMPCGGTYSSSDCGHGTHVAGIVAGRSGVAGSPGPGVAPEASIIAVQVFSRFGSDIGAWYSDVLKGLERVYELRSTYAIASVNMSLGGGQYFEPCDTHSLKGSIDNLRAAGIATIVATGNDGYCGSMAAPACISSAISVGATESSDTDAVAYYSNSAPFMSLLAPGSGIRSSVPGGTYSDKDGTSMATPHVAGAWALMKQVFPAATVAGILDSFALTGVTVTDAGCPSVTKQRINVYEAYNLMDFKAEGTVGTQIIIPTSAFRTKKGKVWIGGAAAKIITWDGSSVTCEIKKPLPPGPYDIMVKSSGSKGTPPITFPEGFVMMAPEIEAVNPSSGTEGTEVTISGNYFNIKKGKVYLGDKKGKVLSWGMDTATGQSTIVFLMPKGLEPGPYPLRVSNKVGTSESFLFTVD